jgi:UDP-N-acetylmuramoyl-tripeptide--D-alanyl-D-alanine ligase
MPDGLRRGSLELTLGWAAGVLEAAAPGEADVVVGEVVTDSRTLRQGDLFVALRGPRFDGHAFVDEVLGRGAAGAVVERGRGGGAARTIEVDDTLTALQLLAHAVRMAAGT